MLNKRLLIVVVLLVMSMGLLAGCGSPEPTAIPTPTAVPTLASVPTLIPAPATATATAEPAATLTPLPATATALPTTPPTTPPTITAAVTATITAAVIATVEVTSTAGVTGAAPVAPTTGVTKTTDVTATSDLTATRIVATTSDVTSTAEVTSSSEITATSGITAATAITTGAAMTLTTAATSTAPVISSLVVAINAAFKPFVYQDDSGNVAGFDVDLINAIGDVANVEIGLVDVGFSELLPGVASGKYDAAISAISVTPDRSFTVSFTTPYFSTGQAPVSFFNPGQGLTVVAGTKAITGVASLTSITKIGVKAETTGAAYVPAETPAQAVAFPDAKDAFAALEKGEVDAVIIDIPIIAEYIKSNPGSIMLAGGPITEEAYAIAVDKDRPAVLVLLNDALAELRANGAYQTLIQKWFGTP